MKKKNTLVLGASTNPSRYAYKAINRLRSNGHHVTAIGIKEGNVGDVSIILDRPLIPHLHTITLYLNPSRQKDYYDYILQLNPKRIIFNPGTENAILMKLAREHGIEVEAACTLVMLSLNQY